jgi:hypothetical protein
MRWVVDVLQLGKQVNPSQQLTPKKQLILLLKLHHG